MKKNFSPPLILNLQKGDDRLQYKKLIKNKALFVRDDYEQQLREYFSILNPPLVYSKDFNKHFLNYKREILKKMPLQHSGRWVYFPWLSTLVHILEEKAFQHVRTARNRNLITHDEQEKFYNATIGIAGLSVGNSVALAIALQGGGRHIRLADHDHLELTNTNRIRCGIQHLGQPKVEITAQQIYEINPYITIELFPEGLTPKNIDRFFSGRHPLDIVIDEIDNVAMKFLIREHAKRYRLPVVMGTDNGDNAVIDVERYDKDSRLQFFHGRMGKIAYNDILKLDKFELGKLITRFVGTKTVTARMKESLMEMGKTIVSWPQLGGAALLNGSAVAYCVRKILNHQPLRSDRILISLDEKLIPQEYIFEKKIAHFDTWISDRAPRKIRNKKKVTPSIK